MGFLKRGHLLHHQELAVEQASSSFSSSSFSGPMLAIVEHRPRLPKRHSGARLQCFQPLDPYSHSEFVV